MIRDDETEVTRPKRHLVGSYRTRYRQQSSRDSNDAAYDWLITAKMSRWQTEKKNSKHIGKEIKSINKEGNVFLSAEELVNRIGRTLNWVYFSLTGNKSRKLMGLLFFFVFFFSSTLRLLHHEKVSRSNGRYVILEEPGHTKRQFPPLIFNNKAFN